MFLQKIFTKDKKAKKALKNQGFTLLELIIVIAVLAVLIGFAAVGINGYYKAADQLERSEIAETSFYSLQSYVNYLERQGELEEFEKQVIVYNNTVYGQPNILSTEQNRMIIELNYEEGDGAAFYTNEYYPDHVDSQIIYIALDKDKENRESNPLYPVLAAALQNDEAMENSFLVEYDLSTGVVRSVFYSEDADYLSFHFGAGGDAYDADNDCIYRDAGSLVAKEQGYYGLTFTAIDAAEKIQTVLAPKEATLINGDRLYLTWVEENNNNPGFTSGGMQMDELTYIVTLYDQDGNMIAVYEMNRGDMYVDSVGTETSTLNYLDDYATPVADTMAGSTKTARVGYADLSYTESPDGIAGERYYLLLECLDHPFGQNGYDFDPEDIIYANVDVAYGAAGSVESEESIDSNRESVYFAYVENGAGAKEFGIACSRHLWNVRNGRYDGDYRLIADVDWANIENRGRRINFTSTQFEDEVITGTYNEFAGTFTGEKTGDAAESDSYRYSAYRINGVDIYEEENEWVGLFTVNRGSIDNIILSNFTVGGAEKVGALAGWNVGTMEDICVLNTGVEGNKEVGGLTGYNEGTITNCTVTTGTKRIIAWHTVGGVAGFSRNSITNSQTAVNVETVLPEDTQKISNTSLGKYAGGVIGYLEAGTEATELYSGVLLDKATGLPLAKNWETRGSRAGIEAVRACSDVTGVGYVGGIIGEIEDGSGEFTNLYNYARLNVTYVDVEERTARNDRQSYIYRYFGGITGRLYAGNSLKDCANYAVVAMEFRDDGQACDAQEIFTYIEEWPYGNWFYNNPRFIGGITGHNSGTVEDCISACTEYGTWEEELESYHKVYTKEEGVYVGYYVGGFVGYNAGPLVFTDRLSTDTMQVVVKGTRIVGGLTGAAGKENVTSEMDLLTVDGIVAAQLDKAGGVAATMEDGLIVGAYRNAGCVMGQNAGGIVAYLKKGVEIKDCSNTGLVFGRGSTYTGANRSYVGGIVGGNYGTVTDCTNEGSVSISHLLTDVPASETVVYGTFADIGGVVGLNRGIISNCHSRLNAEKDNFVVGNDNCYTGGLVGRNVYNVNDKLGVIEHDGREVVDISIVVGDIRQNFAARVGGIVGTAEGALPLKDFTYSGAINVKVTVTAAHCGVGGIMGAMQAGQSMSGCIMSGTITSKAQRTGGLVGIMVNGVIDGSNDVTAEAVIQGVTYTGGIVGMHMASDTASRMDIMENKATVSGNIYVGGIVGHVSNGYILDLSNRSNSGQVTGVQYVGGLAGSYNMGTLTEVTNCVNTGNVYGKKMVGGIIGTVQASDQTVVRTFSGHANSGTIMANTAGSSGIGGIAGEILVPFTVSDCVNKGEIGQLDVSYQTSNVGGIAGQIMKGGTVENCSNSGNVSGYVNVGGIAGNVNFGTASVTIQNCTNEANTRLVATGGNVGGMLGKAGSSYAPLTVTNCTNRGSLDSPHEVGGVVGKTENVLVDISDCHNYGVIGQYSAGRWTIYNAGGMVGYVYSTNQDVTESIIKDCTQNANMYQIKNQSNGAGIGGMVGRSYGPIRLESCSYGSSTEKYSINTLDMAYAIGGIIGNCGKTTIIDCHSNVDVEGDSAGYWIGGIAGIASRKITIGEQGKEDTYCDSYGDINLTKTVVYSGGILGHISGYDFAIYGSTNYGNIGEKAVRVAACGGVVGYASLNQTLEADGILEDCTQLGQIYQGNHSLGGMVGYNTYHNIYIKNCANGAEDIADSGNIYVIVNSSCNGIGGLVGSNGGQTRVEGIERNLLLQQSVNYGDIYLAANVNYVGGLVGYCSAHLTIGDEADAALTCYNYGNIYGSGQAAVNYAGGIAGGLQSYLKSTVHIYDAINYGDIGEGLKCVAGTGGIVGSTWMNGEFSKCTNLGKITNIAGSSAGGIVGYISTVQDMAFVECVNGEKDNTEKGTLEVDGRTIGVGGIVGRFGSDSASAVGDWSITDCVNYADISMNASGYWIGGICGVKSQPTDLTIENTDNYGNITVKGFFVNRIGGIMGFNTNAGGIVYIGASLADGSTDVDKACTNYGEIRFEESGMGSRVGGIVGEGNNITMYGTVNEADISHDDTSVVSGVGGMAGYLAKVTYLQDCKQNGVLYLADFYEAHLSDRNYGAGGMAAYLYGDASFIRCDNGSKEARDAGEADGSIFAETTIVNEKDGTKAISAIGGMVGRSFVTSMHMEECNNYGDISLAVDSANGIGGFCGATGGEEVYLACNNYGDITIDGILTSTGGMIGSVSEWLSDASYVTRFGSAEDPALACNNYGNIVFGGTKESQTLGGFVGTATRPIEIYDSVNSGDIGRDDGVGLGYSVGGFVGQINAPYPSIISGCTQKGTIRQSYYRTGGIAGYVYTDTTFINCVNGVSGDAEAGKIYTMADAQHQGGIVGVGRNVTIQSCVNYADIEGEGRITYLGGVVGYISNYATIDSCINAGNIGVGYTRGSRIGGIVGNAGPVNDADLVASINVKITNCTNESTLLGDAAITADSAFSYVGGIVGRLNGGMMPENSLVENCTNKGDIGWAGFPGTGEYVGGIAGTGSGIFKDCTNQGNLYAGCRYTGGIVGMIPSYTKFTTVTGCTNEGTIQPTLKAENVGGIVGYFFCSVNSQDPGEKYKEILIVDCINRGDFLLPAGVKNTWVGGIFGRVLDNSWLYSNLNILRCENYGNIENAYASVGGVFGSTSSLDTYLVSECSNYGNITAIAAIGADGWQAYGGIGGICGYVGNGAGGFSHCINTGTISGPSCRMGGLVGATIGGYFTDCYHLGHVVNTANYMTGDLIGRAENTPHLTDCYIYSSDIGKLIGTSTGTPITIWQATNGTDGYFDQNVYVKLCEVFEIASARAWDAADLYGNAKYLTENYKYDPGEPIIVVENFVYTPADFTNEQSVPKITWSISSQTPFPSEGMEIYLYESTLSDAEILADEDGSLAYYQTKLNPWTKTMNYSISRLPAQATTYKVVIRILGYTTAEGVVLSTDLEKEVKNEITLQAAPVTTLSLREPDVTEEADNAEGDVSGGDVSGNDVSSGDVSGGDVSGNDVSSGDVSGGDVSGNDVSSGDVSGGNVSGNDVSSGDVSGGDVSGNDVSSGDVSGGNISGNDASGNDISGGGVSGNDATVGGSATGGNNVSKGEEPETDTTPESDVSGGNVTPEETVSDGNVN